jgi:hypothetical protein
MHLALFDDGTKTSSKASLDSTQAFSISRNLVQRKHESNNMEMDREFAVNSNSEHNKGESAASHGKFNDFVTASTNRKTIVEQQRRLDDSRAQSFFQFLKCCCKSNKINEQQQVELNYPLNLHLRMNEIFSLHDKLCDIAECFNDLYSIGKRAEFLL